MREAVSINLGDFLEAGGALGGLWGAPGPKTSVCEGGWHDFGHLRGCPGSLGAPWGRHWVPVCCPGRPFGRLFDGLGAEPRFLFVLGSQNGGKTVLVQRGFCR